MDSKNTRILTLDVVRIVAVLYVIMIHICSSFLSSYYTDTSEFFYGNIFNSISGIGVPLFVMVSGALMLDENRKITMFLIFLLKILKTL